MAEDAVSLIEQVAGTPSIDELARRARRTLAAKEPTEAELRELAEFFRWQRVNWGAKQERENEGE